MRKMDKYFNEHKELVALYDATEEFDESECLDFALSEQKENADGGIVELLNIRLPHAHVGIKMDGEIPFFLIQNGRAGVSFSIRADQIETYALLKNKDAKYNEMDYSLDINSSWGAKFKIKYVLSLRNKNANSY